MANTSAPQWEDQLWIVRNIPSAARLSVRIFDKDDEKLADDYVGHFEIDNLTNYVPPEEGHKIINPFGQCCGNFHLSIQTAVSDEDTQQLPPYTFDGPCRFSRHDSLAIGRLTMLHANHAYSTWKIQMRRISAFFPLYERQYWNRQYKAAQNIFGHCPISLASQTTIKIGHKVLYGRTLKHNEYGRLNNADDVWKLVFTDARTGRIQPCVYTYIIDDHTWRFSETGHQFFKDNASKHALLANVSESVRYAGEFHPRPKRGWRRLTNDDGDCNEWELVFDNGSGTYSPSADLLINLKELLLFNFPGLDVVTYDYKDPELKESMEQLKIAMKEYRELKPTLDHLIDPQQPSISS